MLKDGYIKTVLAGTLVHMLSVEDYDKEQELQNSSSVIERSYYETHKRFV